MTMHEPQMPQRSDLPADPNYYLPRPSRARAGGAPPERTLDLPLTFTRPPVFGDGESESAYLRSRERALETQRTRWSVAPLCSITAARGLLPAGAEVTISDCAGSFEVMARLVKLGIVLELPAEIAAERAIVPQARYRVAGPDALVVRGRIILPGHDITAADLAVPARPGVPEQAPHVAMDGTGVPGRPGVPARAGTDGEAQLQHLIERGRVIDTMASGVNTPKGHKR
jgi:hypothetical protein